DGGSAGGAGGSITILTTNGQFSYGSATMSASATSGTFHGGLNTITAAPITSAQTGITFKANRVCNRKRRERYTEYNRRDKEPGSRCQPWSAASSSQQWNAGWQRRANHC